MSTVTVQGVGGEEEVETYFTLNRGISILMRDTETLWKSSRRVRVSDRADYQHDPSPTESSSQLDRWAGGCDVLSPLPLFRHILSFTPLPPHAFTSRQKMREKDSEGRGGGAGAVRVDRNHPTTQVCVLDRPNTQLTTHPPSPPFQLTLKLVSTGIGARGFYKRLYIFWGYNVTFPNRHLNS